MNSLKVYRLIGLLEGISYILLLFVAWPLKHFADYPLGVKLLGMPHGLLFISYIIYTFIIGEKYQWKFPHYFQAVLASLLPFGTFVFDKKVLQKLP